MSNNDKTVKVFSLPSMTLITTISFPVAINYACLSPDGKFLVAVGDSNQTYLHSAVPNSGKIACRSLASVSLTTELLLLSLLPRLPKNKNIFRSQRQRHVLCLEFLWDVFRIRKSGRQCLRLGPEVDQGIDKVEDDVQLCVPGRQV